MGEAAYNSYSTWLAILGTLFILYLFILFL